MRKINYFLICLLALALNACVQVEYIGQKAAPLDDSQDITFYRNLEAVPDNYRAIGRAEVMLPVTYLHEDVEMVFAEDAREIGASVVAFTVYKKVLVGVTDKLETYPNRPRGSWGRDSTNLDGSKVYTNSFGKEESLKVVRHERYKLNVKATYFVPKDETVQKLENK